MTTFVLICLGVIAMCSLMTFLFMIFFLSDFDELISEIKSNTDNNRYAMADIYASVYEIRELKREKARKKYICSNERDLK